MIFILIIFQLLFVIFLFAWAGMSFIRSYRVSDNHPTRQFALELLVFIGVFFCFYLNNNVELIPVTAGYYDFLSITFLGSVAYWLKKLIPNSYKLALTFSNILIGLLFWMTIVAIIKLTYFYPLAVFPIFGLLIIAPAILALAVLADILYARKSLHPSYILLISLAILFLYTIFHNMWSNEPWELLNWWIKIKTSIF